MKTKISAEVHTDDSVAEAKFDATPWFEQASDDEILKLAACQWGGDYPADDVALFFDGKDEGVMDVFKYHGQINRRETMGFECRINEDEARAWVKENRPKIVLPED